MANRTMLIAASHAPVSPRDARLQTIGLSEFAYDVPLVYKLLVSVNPRLCHSSVFEMETPLAIAGDAREGLARLKSVRDALKPGAENLGPIDQAIAFLSKAHHDYPVYLLEPAEVFDMSADPLPGQMQDLLADIKALDFTTVIRAASGPVTHTDWATDCWTNVLFFVPRGAVEPPKVFDTPHMGLTTGEAVEYAAQLTQHQTLESLRLETHVDDPNLAAALTVLAQIARPFHLTIHGAARTLPDTIGDLTQIDGLNITSLGLERLPDRMSDLKQLTHLVVSRNRLTTLPDTVQGMTQLSAVKLSDNLFETLPDWLSDLPALTEIDVMGNPISALPERLWKMDHLQRLYIGATNITQIPGAIGGLTALTGLNIADLGLTEVPDALWGLTNLTGITLKNNPIGPAFAPGTLARLIQLKQIDFMGCGLTEFPHELCDLPDLNRIDARKNALTHVPDCIRAKPLKWIGLQGNPHPYSRDDFNASAIGL